MVQFWSFFFLICLLEIYFAHFFFRVRRETWYGQCFVWCHNNQHLRDFILHFGRSSFGITMMMQGWCCTFVSPNPKVYHCCIWTWEGRFLPPSSLWWWRNRIMSIGATFKVCFTVSSYGALSSSCSFIFCVWVHHKIKCDCDGVLWRPLSPRWLNFSHSMGRR